MVTNQHLMRVAKDWRHPRDSSGNFKPLYSKTSYEIFANKFMTIASKHGLKYAVSTVGPPPSKDDCFPEWTRENSTHYALFVGSVKFTPISITCPSLKELAIWLASNETKNSHGFADTDYNWVADLADLALKKSQLEFPVYSYTENMYFFDEDDLLFCMEKNNCNAESLDLRICEKKIMPEIPIEHFNDYFSDYLVNEDGDDIDLSNDIIDSIKKLNIVIKTSEHFFWIATSLKAKYELPQEEQLDPEIWPNLNKLRKKIDSPWNSPAYSVSTTKIFFRDLDLRSYIEKEKCSIESLDLRVCIEKTSDRFPYTYWEGTPEKFNYSLSDKNSVEEPKPEPIVDS